MTQKKLIWKPVSAPPSSTSMAMPPLTAAPPTLNRSTSIAPQRAPKPGYAAPPPRKIARMPTTTARTPRPSANAAPMMNVARIWAAASGLRPIALVDMPVRMPMPMPGPMTPSAARPAPICSMGVGSSCLARWVTGSCGPDCMIAASRGFGEGRSGGDVLRGDVALGQVLGEPLVTLRMIVVVGLDRDEREHEGQDAEDQRLHEVEQELEADHGHRDDDERQARDDAEGDLAGVDVAEESH